MPWVLCSRMSKFTQTITLFLYVPSTVKRYAPYEKDKADVSARFCGSSSLPKHHNTKNSR